MVITEKRIDELRTNLPELPDAKKERFIDKYKIKEYDAEIIANEKDVSDLFEELVKNRDPKFIVSWITVELFS